MDKYEFNIKVEQIKKLVGKGDFQTAMKIADTIDWKRVRNANLLSTIASVYEKNEEYQEAKDILLIAFERAPVGKRLLYKLSQLAIKQGNIQEAESYYREFCDLAGDDSRQDVLRYLILKAKEAPLEQLIHSLESYTSVELDEKWLYELAELYHKAGMQSKCVETCDKIMLMFGLGQYVDKAMELKLLYAPLTKYQMDLVENRDKYEEKLRMVEQNGGKLAAPAPEAFQPSSPNPVISTPSAARAASEGNMPSASAVSGRIQPAASAAGHEPVRPPAPVAYEPFQPAGTAAMPQAFAGMTEDQSPVRVRVEPKPIPVPPPSPEMYYRAEPVEHAMPNPTIQEEAAPSLPETFIQETSQAVNMGVIDEEKLVANIREAEVEASLAEEMSKISIETYSAEPEKARTRVLKDVKDLKEAEALAGKTKILGDIHHIQERQAERIFGAPEANVFETEPALPHMMVEARTPEIGLAIAVDALKLAHQILRYKHPVAKISGEKLNQKGILASAPKMAGKDLIIENAGDLSDEMLEELNQLLDANRSRMLVVLVDNARQMSGIRKANPNLAEKFREVVSLAEAENHLEEYRRENPDMAAPVRNQVEAEELERSKAVRRETVKAARQQPLPMRQEAVRPVPGEKQALARREVIRQIQPETAQAEAARPVSIEKVRTAQAKAVRPVRTEPVRVRAEAVRPEVSESARIVSMNPQSQSLRQEKAKPYTSDLPKAADTERSAQAAKEYQADENQFLSDEEEVMGIDEFAQYCCQYASQIDCNITGKSMLALYERIEIMEEDGIALTKTAAEDLIEEAADKAEKPSFGKRLTGFFSSKYDKEGLLILKEEHFI